MRDVARNAGIALGTLYRYFPSKEYLFAVAIDRWVHQIESEASAEVSEEATDQRLKVVLRRAIDAVAIVPNWFSVMIALASSRDPLIQGPWEAIHRSTERLLRNAMPDVVDDDAETVIGVLGAIIQVGWQDVFLGSIDVVQLQARVDVTIDLVFSGARRITGSSTEMTSTWMTST
jgi:AcrR family transcriptional regulator